MKRRRSLWESMKRMCWHKLIIPLLRSPHPPYFKARGVAIGVMWAMTPLVGIQMWLVFMTWLFLKKVCKWNFSLPLAIAYTWVTNVFTLVPVYYGFYVTGQIMMGHFDSISGYEQLKGILSQTFLSDLGFVEQWTLFFKLLLQDWGVAMAVGCLPWALVWGVGSYYMTLKFFEMRQKKKELKKAKGI